MAPCDDKSRGVCDVDERGWTRGGSEGEGARLCCVGSYEYRRAGAGSAFVGTRRELVGDGSEPWTGCVGDGSRDGGECVVDGA